MLTCCNTFVLAIIITRWANVSDPPILPRLKYSNLAVNDCLPFHKVHIDHQEMCYPVLLPLLPLRGDILSPNPRWNHCHGLPLDDKIAYYGIRIEQWTQMKEIISGRLDRKVTYVVWGPSSGKVMRPLIPPHRLCPITIICSTCAHQIYVGQFRLYFCFDKWNR